MYWNPLCLSNSGHLWEGMEVVLEELGFSLFYILLYHLHLKNKHTQLLFPLKITIVIF